MHRSSMLSFLHRTSLPHFLSSRLPSALCTYLAFFKTMAFKDRGHPQAGGLPTERVTRSSSPPRNDKRGKGQPRHTEAQAQDSRHKARDDAMNKPSSDTTAATASTDTKANAPGEKKRCAKTTKVASLLSPTKYEAPAMTSKKSEPLATSSSSIKRRVHWPDDLPIPKKARHEGTQVERNRLQAR